LALIYEDGQNKGWRKMGLTYYLLSRTADSMGRNVRGINKAGNQASKQISGSFNQYFEDSSQEDFLKSIETKTVLGHPEVAKQVDLAEWGKLSQGIASLSRMWDFASVLVTFLFWIGIFLFHEWTGIPGLWHAADQWWWTVLAFFVSGGLWMAVVESMVLNSFHRWVNKQFKDDGWEVERLLEEIASGKNVILFETKKEKRAAAKDRRMGRSPE
jgi:hypothetical protein